MNKDYYAILGIEKSATKDDIKKAYRKKAVKCHPDTNPDNPNAEEEFKELSEAYRILYDENERAYYDRTGSTRDSGTNSNYRPDMNDMFGTIYNQAFGNYAGANFFSNIRPKRTRRIINPDIKLSTNISIENAITGCKTKVSFVRKKYCEDCEGMGLISKNEDCGYCGGTGVRRTSVSSMFNIELPCEHCDGTGKRTEVCKACGGSAYKDFKSKIVISIPAGVKPRSILKVDKMGNEVFINDKKVGDLFIMVDFNPHKNGIELRNGSINATIRVPIDMSLAEDSISVDILGCTKVDFKLDCTKRSGETYSVKNEKSECFDFIKVLLDLPKNNIDIEKREKIISLLRDIYGEESKEFKPLSDGATDS